MDCENFHESCWKSLLYPIMLEVDCFKYMVWQVAADGGCVWDMVHRMNEGYRAWGALKSVVSNRGLGILPKKCIYKVVIVPTVLYGAEAWGMKSSQRRQMNVFEKKCLRSLVGVSRMYRVRNEEVRRRAGIERVLASRSDQRALRWFGHVERMDEYCMARRVLMAEVSERLLRGRPWLGWMDGVKVALGNKGMTVEAARQYARDRKEWRAWYICNKISFTRPFLLGSVFFRTAERTFVCYLT